MNIYLEGLLWVCGAVIFAATAGYLVRRFGQDEGRPGNNDAAGQVFTIISGLQAVIIAFVLISLFDRIDQVEKQAAGETDSLAGLTWAMAEVSSDSGAAAAAIGTQYLHTVVEDEWPKLQANEPVTGQGAAQLAELRRVISEAPSPPDDSWTSERKNEAARLLAEVEKARQDRLSIANDDPVKPVIWVVLVGGSLLVVLLPNLFGGTRPRAHVIMVSTLGATMALLLFAIFQLQDPFSGGVKVEPDAFEATLNRLT